MSFDDTSHYKHDALSPSLLVLPAGNALKILYKLANTKNIFCETTLFTLAKFEEMTSHPSSLSFLRSLKCTTGCPKKTRKLLKSLIVKI